MSQPHDIHATERESGEAGRKGGEAVAGAYAVPAAQPYALNWTLLLIAGFLATLAITLLLYLIPPLIGMPPMDVATQLGTMLLPQGGRAAFWLGMMWHFINGLLFTAAYAGVLLALRKQSTAGTGFWFGGIMWILAMLMMPVLMSMHPLVRAGQMSNPGVFLLNMGLGWIPALFDLFAHLVFGVAAGIIYKHQVREPVAAEIR